MNTIIPNGKDIRRLRILKGYSIRGFAKVTNLNSVTIQKIETCKTSPNPSTAKKICDALGSEFEDLFEIADKSEREGA